MKYFLVAIVCLSLFLANACSARESHTKPEMARCQEELNIIPEVAASLKSRNKQPAEAGDALSGMEIALTINRMVRSTPDPDRDRDDWCYIESTRENFDKLLKALKWLLDDLADVGEDCDPETGQEYDSYKYARRIHTVGNRAVTQEQAKAPENKTSTPTPSPLHDGQSHEYKVNWTIDITANSPREAAQEARRIQLDPDSTATVFDVSVRRTTETIDLNLA